MGAIPWPGFAQDSAPQVISKKGGGVQWKNPAELKAAALAGNPLACAQLGELLLRGERGLPKDGQQAVELLEKAARAGVPSAAFRIGMLLDDGDGLPQDRTRALAYFRSAAAGDFSLAYHNVGAAYAGAHGVKRDYVEALGWLMLAKNHGVGADSEQAVRDRILKLNHPEWISAAEKRTAEIEHELGSKPPPEFLPPPAPLTYAESGRPEALAIDTAKTKGSSAAISAGVVTLGAVKVSGAAARSALPDGAEVKVVSPAGKWQRWPSLDQLERAADAGDPEALSALGQVLLEGKFAPIDVDRAVALLDRAARAGSVDAAQQLASLYTQGGKIPADAAKAFQYNLQAARGGAPQAMYNTGAMLSNGLGTARNFTEALAWLIVAKQHGRDPGSEKQMRDYLTKTAPAQVALAEQRAAGLQREIDATGHGR